MREACPAANAGSGTPPSSPRRPSNNRGVTGRGTSNLLDVRLGRAAAQDDPRGRHLDRLAQADSLGQPNAPQQVGLPGRGRLPRAAVPAKRNDQRLILRAHAFARCAACLEAAGIPLVGASEHLHTPLPRTKQDRPAEGRQPRPRPAALPRWSSCKAAHPGDRQFQPSSS